MNTPYAQQLSVTTDQLTECISELSPVTLEVSFHDAIQVKVTPHSWPINIYGASTNPERNRVSLLDSNGEWHELSAFDAGYAIVSNSVYQRLKALVLHKQRKGGVAA